LPRN